jgi:hypothetical protein
MTKQSEYKLKFNRRKKEQAISLFGAKCQKCGYNKCMGALDFHHINGKKDTEISSAIIQWKWERAKTELDKCILLCANCHRETHYNADIDYTLVNLKRSWIHIICPVCKKEVDTKVPTQKYCSPSCQHVALRKLSRPTKEDLQKLIMDEISWVQMGKMFNVSDVSVKKWAKQYDLV